MRALTVLPGQAGSGRLDEVPELAEAAGAVLVDGTALGICGTDGQFVQGEYRWSSGLSVHACVDRRPRS
jgi:glucose 1-dehydrogenase